MSTCERMGADKPNDNNNTRLEEEIVPASGGQVQERRYGCYRLGVAVAIVIIVVLVIGTVPVFVSIENEKVILIVTIVTLAIVGILLLIYCLWQRSRAVVMRREVSQRELEYLDHAAS